MKMTDEIDAARIDRHGRRGDRRLIPMVVWVGLICFAVACGATRTASATPQINLDNIITSVRVFPNLNFVFPIALVQLPGESGRWYVAEQGGKVFSFPDDNDVTEKQLALDITEQLGGIFFDDSQQWGITGIAVHVSSAAATMGEVVLFVAYNAKSTEDGSVTSFVSRFRSSDGGLTFDEASETMLFVVPQRNKIHHLGQVVFGPDGYLYIGFGDGGVRPTAQDLNDLRGSILRVDVNGAEPYAIPGDNPLVGTGQREEIFTWGWRNPWRFSLDAVTGDLWAGDVGGNDREEVTRAVPGRSHGWPAWEGTLCIIETPCDGIDNVLPELEYDHDTGTAAIGGYVYRGTLIPALQGMYIFSDWSRGKRLWAVLYDAEGRGKLVTLGWIAGESERPSGFAVDRQNELYHVSAQDDDGGIYKIVPNEDVDHCKRYPRFRFAAGKCAVELAVAIGNADRVRRDRGAGRTPAGACATVVASAASPLRGFADARISHRAESGRFYGRQTLLRQSPWIAWPGGVLATRSRREAPVGIGRFDYLWTWGAGGGHLCPAAGRVAQSGA